MGRKNAVRIGGIGAATVQGGSAPGRTAARFAERNCLSATVPRPRTRRAHPRRSYARAIVDLARSGHDRAERNESERLVLSRLAIVRLALPGALGRRNGPSPHLRKTH